jgi:uncharacterized membrane protein YeiB/ABC-type multidrug transport system ATPase subunit
MDRIRSLDLIRGFALLGVLLVNAPHFASAPATILNPGHPAFAVGDRPQWAWLWTHIGFEYKSITLFSMLFGASLCLVGGDGRDPTQSRTVHWRLFWLGVFGLAHGLLIWWGDILLSYAIAGALVVGLRGWSARNLIAFGALLTAVSIVVLILASAPLYWMSEADRATVMATQYAPDATEISATVAAWTGGFFETRLQNVSTWVEWQVPLFAMLTPRTAGLMLIGMGLFKSGFLSGQSTARTYLVAMAGGALALAILGVHAWSINLAGFPLARTLGADAVLTAALSTFVALGYVGALIFLLCIPLLGWANAALSAFGRMAFTNYLTQSIALSLLFWGGPGFGLYGQLDRDQVALVALTLFAIQVVTSLVWLRFFSAGPLEMLWRRLVRFSVTRSTRQSSAQPTSRGYHAGADAPLAIETIGLGRKFGETWVVRDVDLQIGAGKIYGFLGANGAGKTTTLRMLLGLLRPSTGRVLIQGQEVDVSASGNHKDYARRIGALLDAKSAYPHLTARENLEISRAQLGLPRTEIDRVLEIVSLSPPQTMPVASFSLGTRQRLGLARALLGSPPILILDEPLNGLDPDGIQDMRRIIRSLPYQCGATVLLSSHLLSEVELTASHVGVMRAGRLAAQGAVASLLEDAATQIRIRALDVDKAQQALATLGHHACRSDPWLSMPLVGGSAGAAAILTALIHAGVEVAESAMPSATLEDLYCNIRAHPA